jgi:hypothetical protein
MRSVCAGWAFVALVVTSRASGYGLELAPRDDTVRHVAPSDVAEFHFTLTNTGTTLDVYEFSCRVVSAVPGWAAVYCVNGVCVEPGVLSYDSIPAGASDTTPKVTVYTNATEGEETVSLCVRSLGDTTLAESVATHTVVASGIEEVPGDGAHGVWLQVSPEPVRRGGSLTLRISTRRPTSFSACLFNSDGGRVGRVAAGTTPSDRHEVRWCPARLLSRGVYLLRVTAGDRSAVRKLVIE